jgi:thiamine transport system substrate-binding protein
MTDELVAQFEEETGYKLEIIRLGDTGSLTYQLVLTKNAPVADSVFGIDNTFRPVADENQIIDGELVPIDYSDVCFNYDISALETLGVQAPYSWRDLVKAEYRGLTVITDPALSSPGLAFLATTVAGFDNDNEQQNYWSQLFANEVLVAGSWEDAYFTHFTRYGGNYPIVLSYASSPSAEVNEDGSAGTAALLDQCFRQTEFAGVIAGAENKRGAEALVDFLTSEAFQLSVAENMYVYPIEDVSVPETWAKFAPAANSTVGEDLDFALNRDGWLSDWQSLKGD